MGQTDIENFKQIQDPFVDFRRWDFLVAGPEEQRAETP